MRGNPQIENGHIDIANEIAEALAGIRISGEEWQVLLVIFRKTYGWHKKEDWIPLNQFVELTGLSKPHIIRAIKKLIQKNIIAKKGNKKGKTYGFNKHYKEWKPLPKKATLPKKAIVVAKKGNPSLPIMVPSKENTSKETITKEKVYKQKIKFNSQTNKFENITPEDLKKWKEVFSNVESELKKMEIWLAANPARLKKNYEKFIFNWLSNQKGGKYEKNKGSNERYVGISAGTEKERFKDEPDSAKPGEW